MITGTVSNPTEFEDYEEYQRAWREFWYWSDCSEEWSDRIGVRRCWIDMAGDHAGGVFLAQLVYWSLLPPKGGQHPQNKLTIGRFERMWLAKSYKEWWQECRLKPSQVTRIVKSLRDKGLIDTRIMKFRGSPTLHIAINHERFVYEWDKAARIDPDWSDCLTELRES